MFFYNDTISKNIAFGESEDAIDHDRINFCLKICALEKFIKENKNGVNTIIGENGNRLSGGQRQRLGIARLYIEILKYYF